MFKEVQRFNQIWVWLLLSGLFLSSLYIFTKIVVLEQPVGSQPISKIESSVLLGLMSLITFGLWKIRLKTKIDLDGIRVTYAPFVNRYVTWKDVASVEIINYGFAGYGIRFSFKYSWIYNVDGNLGLLVILENGKKYVIGTQNETELRIVLKELGKI